MKSINPRWFPPEVKTKEEKEQFERSIRNGTTALKRLQEIIEAHAKSLEAPKSMEDYDSPGWATKQADRLGQLRAYRTLLTLLEFIPNDQRR